MHFRCAIMALAENGPLVKRLRHRPLTAKTWVRFPYGSPKKQIPHPRYLLLSFGGPYGIQNPSPSRRLGRVRIPRAEQRPLASRWQAWVYSPKAKFPYICAAGGILRHAAHKSKAFIRTNTNTSLPHPRSKFPYICGGSKVSPAGSVTSGSDTTLW